jgi:hypothetical protein
MTEDRKTRTQAEWEQMLLAPQPNSTLPEVIRKLLRAIDEQRAKETTKEKDS